ncbi:MAG: hypothetical protein M3463_00570 [Verrucomicrobiota bacterium]|nr:hypothetical protein [Verrucomicrobiota bacterium]
MKPRSAFLVFLASIVLTACAAPPPEGPAPLPAGQPKLVYTVDKVTVRTLESFPERLVVEASGTARTGGWTAPQLRLRAAQTRDGTLTFDFVARPAEGIATQAITPIKASVTLEKPKFFRRVRVVAETNDKLSE